MLEKQEHAFFNMNFSLLFKMEILTGKIEDLLNIIYELSLSILGRKVSSLFRLSHDTSPTGSIYKLITPGWNTGDGIFVYQTEKRLFIEMYLCPERNTTEVLSNLCVELERKIREMEITLGKYTLLLKSIRIKTVLFYPNARINPGISLDLDIVNEEDYKIGGEEYEKGKMRFEAK